MKCLWIKTADGNEWVLPLEVPAAARAKYYAEKDKDTTYDEEFQFAMGDDYEAVDWLRNNMNYDEYSASLTLYKAAPKWKLNEIEWKDWKIREIPSVHDKPVSEVSESERKET